MPRVKSPHLPIFQRKTGSNWHLRLSIPRELQRFFAQANGKPRAELSPANLKTRDSSVALVRASAIWADHQSLLARLRGGEVDEQAALTQFRELAEREFVEPYRAALERRAARAKSLANHIDEWELRLDANGPMISEVALEFHRKDLARRRGQLARARLYPLEVKRDLHGHIRDMNDPRITVAEEAASEFAAEHYPHIIENDAARMATIDRLSELFRAAGTSVVTDALDRFETDGALPRKPTTSKPVNAAERTPDLTLQQYYETEFRPKRGVKMSKGQVGIRAATLEKSREGMEYFTDIMGTMHVAEVTPEHALDFAEIYRRVPRGWVRLAIHKGKPLRELVAIADATQPGCRRLAPETVNAVLGGLRNIFRYALKQRHVKLNPFVGVSLETAKDRIREPSFTIGELNTLFKAPIFTGCAADDDERTTGNYLVRDHRYWAHFCLLFTGARVSEIGGIRADQVILLDHERGYFDFDWTEGDDGRGIKNSSSVRIVPIHAELVKLGFLDFVKSMQAAGHERLFPRWKPNTRNCDVGVTKKEFSSSDWVKRFYRYPSWVSIQRKGLSLKSYRSAWETATLGTSYNERTLQKITGRAQSSNSLDHYLPTKAEFDQMKPIVDAIHFEGLDLSHLYPSDRKS